MFLHLTLTSADRSPVTVLEVLQDFADATPTWNYLEADTDLYRVERALPACVLRYRMTGSDAIDLVFMPMKADAHDTAHLRLMLGTQTPQITPDTQQKVLNDFLDAFRSHLSTHAPSLAIDVQATQPAHTVA